MIAALYLGLSRTDWLTDLLTQEEPFRAEAIFDIIRAWNYQYHHHRHHQHHHQKSQKIKNIKNIKISKISKNSKIPKNSKISFFPKSQKSPIYWIPFKIFKTRKVFKNPKFQVKKIKMIFEKFAAMNRYLFLLNLW